MYRIKINYYDVNSDLCGATLRVVNSDFGYNTKILSNYADALKLLDFDWDALETKIMFELNKAKTVISERRGVRRSLRDREVVF